jgi:nicotinamidase-related amidase
MNSRTTLWLADSAKFFKLPTILTTSFEDGPNGPLMPEIKALFPDAPYIARPGQINAWDNQDFVDAVKATGKKQLLIAGVVTEGLCGLSSPMGARRRL